jgi:hypothetical protein
MLRTHSGRRLRLELLEPEARALEQAVSFALRQFERAVGHPLPVLDRVHRRLRILLAELDPD